MEIPHRKESRNISGLVLIVLAAFALIVIAASGIGRNVVNTDRTVAPVAVKPATAPATSNQPAGQTAPVSPSPNAVPKAPAP